MSKALWKNSLWQTRIMKINGCWLWTGGKHGDGYAVICLGNEKYQVVHRFVYERLVGPIPEGLELDHLCRVRNCVNPEHLEPVTPRENTRRSNNACAINARKTHCIKGHELAGENLVLTKTGRTCRICLRASQRRYQQRQIRKYQEGDTHPVIEGHCFNGHARTPETTRIQRDGRLQCVLCNNKATQRYKERIRTERKSA